MTCGTTAACGIGADDGIGDISDIIRIYAYNNKRRTHYHERSLYRLCHGEL